MTKRFGAAFCSVSVLALWAGCAHAQNGAATQQPRPPTGAGQGADVVVTAQKRVENIQRVPVAISAFTSAKRDVVGIQTIQDMTNFTPGLGYSTSTDRVTLRGVGRTTNVLSADAPVANYDDGLYETFAVAAGRSSLDLDRVEILRGPQGTLAGRNALGGAINEVTIHPSNTPQAEVRATIGNYDHYTLEAAVTGPIAPGWAFRVYGNWDYQSQGWEKNVVPGMPSEGNVINEWYLDAQIQGHITDKLDMWTKFQSAQWWNGAGGPGAASAGWTNLGGYPSGEFVAANAFLYANTGYACATGSGATNVNNPSPLGCVNPHYNDPWHEARAVPNTVTLPAYYSINTQWTYHTSDFDVKYIGGGTYYHYILTGPNAVSPIVSERLPLQPASFVTGFCATQFAGPCHGMDINGQYHFNYQELNGFWSDEVDLISTKPGPLQWVTGVYQFYQHYRQPVTSGNQQQPELNHPSCVNVTDPNGFGPYVPPGNCPLQTSGLYFNNRPTVNDESYAIFGQVDYKITDTIKLTGGLRYSWDRKFGSESIRLLDIGNILAPETWGSYTNFNVPGIGPAFDLTPDQLVVADHPTKGVSGPTVLNYTTGLAQRNYDASWSDWSGTAGIEWQPDSKTLVYGKYGRGYKSGGFNIGIFTVLADTPWTNKETVDSFEVGLKKTWGHWLTLDAAAYYYSYQNLQIPVTVANTSGGLAQSQNTFYNVPKSVSQGIEIEATITPIENLNILISYSFDDAKITEGRGFDPADPNAIAPGARPLYTPAQCLALMPNSPCSPDIYTQTLAQATAVQAAGGPAIPSANQVYGGIIAGDPNQGWNIPQNLDGNRLPNAPRNKIAVNVLYSFDAGDMGTFIPSISYIWRDVTYGTLYTRSYNAAPSWDEWDARITWKSRNDRMEVIIFGKNLANTIGYDQGAIGARLSSVTNVVGAGTGGRLGTFAYVQGVNGPVGFNDHLAGENAQGVYSTYYPTPPATYGIEFHYKFF